MKTCGHALIVTMVVTAALTPRLTLGSDPGGASLWFPVGEQLRYRIYWGVIPVGEVWLGSSWREVGGQRRIALTFRARTNRVVARLFPVDDFAETIVDPETFLPLTYTKRLSEGRYRADEFTVFDHAARQAIWRSRTKDKQRVVDIEPDTRDLITFVYAMRRSDFAPGTSSVYRLLYDDRVHDFRLRVDGKERFRVSDYGWQTSVKLEPLAAFGGAHERGGRMWVWVSDDERRLCTRVTVAVPIATVSFLLAEVTGPGRDVWVTGGPHATAARR